jgi:hypothetical protein
VLSSTASGQLLSQHEYKTTTLKQTQGLTNKNQRKLKQFRLFTCKCIKISVDIQTAFAAKARLAEGF